MRYRIGTIALAAIALGGCVSLGDLGQKTPDYATDLPGNYLAAAECTKARQAKVVPVRLDLLHDAAKKEAMVTWNHDLGSTMAFVFTGKPDKTTHLAIYSASAVGQQWIDIATDCGKRS